MNIKLVEKIDANLLREMCIKYHWFTYGDNKSYGEFLTKYDGKKPTADRIIMLADCIQRNSESGHDDFEIMTIIYKESVIRFIE